MASDPIERLRSEPARAALFLDIDGALAPIVEDPDDSSVPEPTRVELRRLAGRYGLVACVTGRPGARAREIVGVEELRYAGEHGLELEPEAEAWEERLRTFVAGAGWPAEEKRLTAAFHYRTHPEPERARVELERVAEAARAEGFRARWGRMVLEVVPPIDASKGTAVRRLLDETGLERALYAGDDTTDLDGFRALDGLELAVRVAVASAEGPDELVRLADVVVQGPEGLAELLASL